MPGSGVWGLGSGVALPLSTGRARGVGGCGPEGPIARGIGWQHVGSVYQRLAARMTGGCRNITCMSNGPSVRLRRAALAVLVALACSACSGPVNAGAGEAGPILGSPRLTQAASNPVTMDALVRAALADAAKVSGRPTSALKVIDAAEVVWPDGSGGCPQPDVAYTQALVPGYRIRIQAGKQVLNYHATRHSTAPVLCPADRVQPALPPRAERF